MSLCFVTHLTLTISFGEAWPALQWVVTDSTKHPKQWETGQRRKRKTTRLVLRRATAKVFDFYSMQTSKRIAFSSSPCHLLPKSPLWHPSLFFPLAPPSHSSLHHLLGEQYPPGLWDSFVSELEMLAQPDHVSNFHFLKSLREHPGFYQCPLHWARGGRKGGRSSSYLASHLAINEQTTLSLSWDQAACANRLHCDSVLLSAHSDMCCISSIYIHWTEL